MQTLSPFVPNVAKSMKFTRFFLFGMMCVFILASCGSPEKQVSTVDGETDQPIQADVYNGVFTGTWHRNILGAAATLTFKPVSPERVQFSFDASSGANTGILEGFLHIDGNQAMYETSEGVVCRVRFEYLESGIQVEQEGCEGQAGAGVVFMGMYEMQKTDVKDLAFAALEERIGTDAASAVQHLAGDDFQMLALSMHVNNESITGPEPSQTLAYFVRGLSGYMMACISVNEQTGQVWIAYVENERLQIKGPDAPPPSAFTEWIERTVQDHGMETQHHLSEPK